MMYQFVCFYFLLFFCTFVVVVNGYKEAIARSADYPGCFLVLDWPKLTSDNIKVIANDNHPSFIRTEFLYKWLGESMSLRMAILEEDRPSNMLPFLLPSELIESYNIQAGNFGIDEDLPRLRLGRAGLPFILKDVSPGDSFDVTINLDTLELISSGEYNQIDDRCRGVRQQGSLLPVHIDVIEESKSKNKYRLDILTEFMGSFQGPLYNYHDASYADTYLSDYLTTSNGNRAIIATGNTFSPSQLEGQVNNSKLTLKLLSLLNVQAINVGLGELSHFGYQGLMQLNILKDHTKSTLSSAKTTVSKTKTTASKTTRISRTTAARTRKLSSRTDNDDHIDDHIDGDDDDLSTVYEPPFLSSNIYDKRTGLHAFEPYRIVEINADGNDDDISSERTTKNQLKIAVFGVLSQHDASQLSNEFRDKFDVRQDYIRWLNELCLRLVSQNLAQTCVLLSSDGAVRKGEQLNQETEFAKIINADENFSLFTALVGGSTEQTMNVQSSSDDYVIVQGPIRGGVVQISYTQDKNVPEHVRCTAKLATMTSSGSSRRNRPRELPNSWEAAKRAALDSVNQIENIKYGNVYHSLYRGRDSDGFLSCVQESNLANFAADSVYRYARKENPLVDLALIDCGSFAKDLIVTDSNTGVAITTFDLLHLVKESDPIEIVEVEGYQLRNVLAGQFGVPGLSLRNSFSISDNASYRYDSSKGNLIEDIVINGKYVEPDETYRLATTSRLASRVRDYRLGQIVIKTSTKISGSMVEAMGEYIRDELSVSPPSSTLHRGVDISRTVGALELSSVDITKMPVKRSQEFELAFNLKSNKEIDQTINFYLKEDGGSGGRLVDKKSSLADSQSFIVKVTTMMRKHENDDVEIWGADASWADQSYSPIVSFKASLPHLEDDNGQTRFNFSLLILLTFSLYFFY